MVCELLVQSQSTGDGSRRALSLEKQTVVLVLVSSIRLSVYMLYF